MTNFWLEAQIVYNIDKALSPSMNFFSGPMKKT